jgi:transcriptional regulator with XRE-family HTH domain
MSPAEFSEARENFGLGRREFGRLLGYTGEARNIWITVKRYEEGTREIPPTIERLVRLLVWYKSDFGYLPDIDNGRREPMVMPEVFQDGQ